MPRHTTKPLKTTVKQTVADLWECAEEVAKEAAAEAAERFNLSYKMAFSLLEYMQKYTWACVLSMPHNKGWYTRLYQMAVVEADRIAYKMARAWRSVDEDERRRLMTELDDDLRRIQVTPIDKRSVD